MANINNEQVNTLVDALRVECERIRGQKARSSSLASRIAQLAATVAGFSASDVIVPSRPDGPTLPTLLVSDYNSLVTDLANLNTTLGNITSAHLEKFCVRPAQFDM